MASALTPFLSAALLALSAWLLLRPAAAASAFTRFYTRYPLIRLAQSGQHQARPVVMRIAGFCVALLALAVLLA